MAWRKPFENLGAILMLFHGALTLDKIEKYFQLVLIDQRQCFCIVYSLPPTYSKTRSQALSNAVDTHTRALIVFALMNRNILYQVIIKQNTHSRETTSQKKSR